MTIDAASGANPYASLIANSDAFTATEAAKNAGRSDTSAAAIAKTKTDKDTFLKLLVAQLKYQDPSKPADTTQFMAQTAQFSALETMQEVATSSGSMLAAQNKLQASALIGQTVSYVGPDGKTVSGVVRSASFSGSSAGGTGGEPLLDVAGTKVVLSKVTTVGVEETAAPTTGSAPATGASSPSSSTASSSTPAAGSSSSSASGSSTPTA